MIYSILILVAVIFLFFWVLNNHKKARRESYQNSALSSIINKFKNAEITQDAVDSFCGLIHGHCDSISVEECKKTMEGGVVTGMASIFTKAAMCGK
jgi:hypothetical protein